MIDEKLLCFTNLLRIDPVRYRIVLPDKLLNDLRQLIHGHFHFTDQRIKYAPGFRDVMLINQFLCNQSGIRIGF